jgi:AcrR family transcriptional regulator
MSARERIIEAAGVNFTRRGLLRARLEDICRDAQVSVGALYHHFPDKEALHAEAWLAALSDYQRGFGETLQPSVDAERGVKDAVRYHLRWTVNNRDAALLLHDARPSGPGAIERLREQNREFFSHVLRWWRIHASYRAVRELEPDVLYALWLGPADSYARHWLRGNHRTQPGVVVDQLADAAWLTLKGPDRR